ncbi:hemolysin-III related-domain-containing protein [Entophlyctis helioformis]|nr:hemolysin-III related-domain-containing protein [Entophlyctis helioformis]
MPSKSSRLRKRQSKGQLRQDSQGRLQTQSHAQSVQDSELSPASDARNNHNRRNWQGSSPAVAAAARGIAAAGTASLPSSSSSLASSSASGLRSRSSSAASSTFSFLPQTSASSPASTPSLRNKSAARNRMHPVVETPITISTATSSDSSSGTLRDDLPGTIHAADLISKKVDEHVEAARHPWWSRKRLVYYTFDESPSYLQDNDCIHTGYRAHQTYTEAWISLFHFHNESCNIWSHFLPFFICLAGIVFHFSVGGLHPNASVADYAVVAVYLGCAAYTLITSSLFHLHLGVSREAFVLFGCLDYSGISASICGGACSISYYVLYCDPKARIGWTSALLIVNLVGIIGPLFKFWSGPAFRTGRAMVYLSSGALSCSPMIYFIVNHGVSQLPSTSTSFAMTGVYLMIALYVVGAVIYANRIPECYFPGKFDYILHSHTIWHIFVVTAMWTLYAAVLAMMHWRLDADHTCEASA